jgi:hypothetical protein
VTPYQHQQLDEARDIAIALANRFCDKPPSIENEDTIQTLKRVVRRIDRVRESSP